MSEIARRDILTLAGISVAGGISIPRANATRTTQQSTEWTQFQFDTANTGSNVTITGPQSATLRWSFQTDGVVGSSPAVVPDINAVIVGSTDNHLYGINLNDGSELGKIRFGGPVISSPAFQDGIAYVGGMDRKVYALSREQGDILWSNKFDQPFVSPPCVTDNRVFIGGLDSSVYAFAPKDGSTIWSYDTEAPVAAAPAVSDGKVYIGDGGGTLHAISASDGEPQWTTELGDILHASPAVVDGMVYIGSLRGTPAYESSDRGDDINDKWDQASGGRFAALNAETGEIQWEAETEEPVLSSPAIDDSTVYVGNDSSQLFAVDRSNGEVKWTFDTGSTVRSSPAVGNEAVYVGSGDGNVYAINRFDGSERWTFRTGDWVDSSPALIDGLVVVGSGDGNVYAISDEDTSQQTQSGSTAQMASAEVSNDDSSQRQRGFFSNEGEGPEFLQNVFNLTVLGFLLSVVGIIHQMMQGR